MADFLAPVLRTQFNLFYRFGYTFIPASYLIQFDGLINELVKDKIEELFTFLTPFEYDEEYLILHLGNSEIQTADIFKFAIENIISIYPLSKQAKKSIETKMDARIKFSEPIFEANILSIESVISSNEKEKAIEALWKICDLEGTPQDFQGLIDTQGIEDGIMYRQLGTKASAIQMPSYYSLLIAYDRYDHFPNTTLGYFFDAGQVFAFSKGYPSFEGSALYNLLNQFDPQIRFPHILKYLQENQSAQSYLSQTTQENGIKNFLVAPLFFMLKDELRSLDNVYQSKLLEFPDVFKKYGNEFKIALILLGSFFGFKKFYDVYYDKIKPTFFKSDLSHNSNLQLDKVPISQEVDNATLFPAIERNPKNSRNVTAKKGELDKTQISAFIKDFIRPGEEHKLATLVAELKKHFKKVPNTEVIKNIISNDLPSLQIIKNTVSNR